jgi:hypothetical protein
MLKVTSKAWVKGLARNLRDGGVRSAFGYLREAGCVQLLRGIAKRFAREQNEVHVLTGSERLPMALWMAASLIVSRDRIPRFVIHDDGSLRDCDEQLVRGLLPGARVVRAGPADEAVERKLEQFPLLNRYRKLHFFGKRLTDMSHFCESDYLISVDTDVLFFSNPAELFRETPFTDGKSLFMRDVADSSLIQPEQFLRRRGCTLAGPINAGIFSIHKSIMDWERMEGILADFDLLSVPRGSWFVEQTVLAALTSARGSVELLPETYVLNFENQLGADVVARHYVGRIRHLFYSEGLPLVSKNLEMVLHKSH